MPAANKSAYNGHSAVGLFEIGISDLAPPLRMSVAQYADKHRFVPGAGGGRGERYRSSMTPYLIKPMEDLDSGIYRTVALVGPGQSAKTVAAENWFLKSVGADPANFLWYMQSDEALEAFVKERINPMIDDHEILYKAQGLRSIDDSLHFKRFRGMSAQFLTASMGNLISKSAPRIVADEIDAYNKLFGDVKMLLDVRRQRFKEDSMLFAMSHPDLARGLNAETDWTAGIMSMYADSTRCLWWWACPHCRLWSSPCPIAARVMSINYPEEGTLDEIEANAHLMCPYNQCKITDEMRIDLNRTGRWVGSGEMISKEGRVTGELIANRTAGYWIVGAMSPFNEGIGVLARNRVKAEREMEVSGEDETLRQVIVKQWGIPYAKMRAAGSVTAETLAERAEPDLRLGVVPFGVRFLSCAVDCQSSTFEWLTRGWGVGGESWIVDRGKMLADPATSVEDWDRLLKEVFERTYPLMDGSGRRMLIRACMFDTAGTPGTTAQAYAAWTRWKDLKKIRLYGQIGGREVFNILGLKGNNTVRAAKLQIVYPDTPRKASKMVARGNVPIGLFNPNDFKDDLSGQLQKGAPGPLYVHFPYELRGPVPSKPRVGAIPFPIEGPHPWFEQAVSERQLPNGRWEKLNPNARNETLDELVMTHIGAHLHGLSRINWDRPPPWAAEWDKNVMVIPDPVTIAPKSAEKKGGSVKIKIDPVAKKTIGSRLA